MSETCSSRWAWTRTTISTDASDDDGSDGYDLVRARVVHVDDDDEDEADQELDEPVGLADDLETDDLETDDVETDDVETGDAEDVDSER